jgi:DNA recombination protein RmuC
VIVVALIGVVLVVVAVAAALLPRVIGSQLASLRKETARQLNERNAEVDRRLADVTETLDRRLASSGQTANQIHERLGQVNTVMAEVNERAKDLGRLERALRPPKARGSFGELLLENLLRDCLPPDAYELQYTFPSGQRVDAVIRAGGRLLPIDSKFTFDNFERMANADNEDERRRHAREFGRDVKAKIDEIASKYIRPDYDTFDVAFMYCPAEAIYYEIVSGTTGQLLTYANERRVFPVSATTFHAYLQMIVLGLRGMQIEQRAQEVMAHLAALQKDLGKFKDDFDVVGTHLGNAQKKYIEAEKHLTKFETQLERAADDGDEQVEGPIALPRALDDAA